MIQTTPFLLCIVGLVLCLGGYKIQKIVITLTWFLIGFSLATVIFPLTISDETTIMIASLIVGVILGALGFKLEKLALFVTVAYLTYIFLEKVIIFDADYMNLLVRGGAAALLGALSVLMIRPILIFASTLGGVTIIHNNLPTLVKISSNVNAIICIALIIISLIYQFKTTKD